MLLIFVPSLTTKRTTMKTTTKTVQTFSARIPEHLIGYLFNADADNLTDEEIEQAIKFCRDNNASATDVLTGPYFAHSNDIDTLGATCFDILFVVHNSSN